MMNDIPREPPDLQLHKADKQQRQLVEALNNLEIIKQSMPAILEFQKVMAEIRYKKFEALLAAGFSPEQALALVSSSTELY